jgi:hypothetical protein
MCVELNVMLTKVRTFRYCLFHTGPNVGFIFLSFGHSKQIICPCTLKLPRQSLRLSFKAPPPPRPCVISHA